MQEPVPTGVELVDRATAQTHKDIADSATQAGIFTPKEAVAPDPLHVFEGITNIGGEVVNSVGYEGDKFFHGEGLATGGRTVGGKNWLRSLQERAAGRLKMFQMKKQKPV